MKKTHSSAVAGLVSAAMVLMLVPLSPAMAAEGEVLESGDYSYVLDSDGTAAIMEYSGEEGDDVTITIPQALGGCTVTRIDPFAFHRVSAASIVLPSTVTAISDAEGGELQGLVGPHAYAYGVEAGSSSFKAVDGVLYTADMRTFVTYPQWRQEEAFAMPEGVVSFGPNCLNAGAPFLTSVSLPSTLTELRADQLAECGNIQSITVAYGNPAYCDQDGIVYSADMQELVSYPCGKQGEQYAIPSSVRKVGESAITGQSYLETVAIPASVQEIGENNFTGGTLDSIELDEANEHFTKAGAALLTADGSFFIAHPAGAHVKEYVIPSTVTTLGENAFYRCSIRSVTVPASVAEFHPGCLRVSAAVTDIYVATVDQYDLLDGNSEYITIAYDTVYITEAATGVVSSDIDRELKVGETVAVASAFGKAKFTVLSSTSAKKSAALAARATASPRVVGTVRVDYYPVGKNGEVHLESLRTNYGKYLVTELRKSAFKNRKDVKSAKFENARRISASAFQGCKNLKKADLGSSLASIGSKAFMGCKNLKSVRVSSKKLKAGKVGSAAFKGTAKKAAFQVPKSKLKAYKKLLQKAGASKKASFKKA